VPSRLRVRIFLQQYSDFIRRCGYQVDKMAKSVTSLSRRNCRADSDGRSTPARHQNLRPSHHLSKPHRTGYAHKKSDNINCNFNAENILKVSFWTYPQCANPLHCCY
jgi:hypothetical protein